jgi:hypothetical protein
VSWVHAKLNKLIAKRGRWILFAVMAYLAFRILVRLVQSVA